MKKPLLLVKVDEDELPDHLVPMFSSLEEMCEAWGIDDATKEQMRRDMEFTRPPEPGDAIN